MGKNKKTNQSLKHVFQNVLWMIRFVVKYAPVMIVEKIIRIPILVASTYVSINFARWILDSVAANMELKNVILTIVAIASFFIISNFILAFFNLIILPQKKIDLTAHIREDVMHKVGVIDQINFQKPSFFDSYTLSLNEVDSRAISVLDSIANIITSVISFFLITGITIGVSSAFSFFAFAAATVEIVVGIIAQKYNYKQSIEKTPSERKRGYIGRVTYQPEFSSDLKIYPNFISLLIYRYREATDSVKKIILRYAKKLIVLDQSAQIPVLILRQTLPWIVIAMLLFKKIITIPEATVLTAAAIAVPNSLTGFLNGLSGMYVHSLYIENLRKIFEFPENIEIDDKEKIELATFDEMNINNLCFSYDGDNKKVLNCISMDIKKGEKIALVGYNGAGKSTLAKILVRLFEATGGLVEINGMPITSYNAKSVRSRIAYLSQDYKIYGFTIAENVLMRSVVSEDDRTQVDEILKKVGLYEKVQNLEHGVDTFITREFDEKGEYFSGGELQKLSLARLYAGNYDFIIMDESTSSLDPLGEDEIIRTIFDIFREKTIIMISHRLATIKYVDKVWFMSQGEIVEHGTHSELMSHNSEYASFYFAQANKYYK